jgi:hypothetical protein
MMVERGAVGAGVSGQQGREMTSQGHILRITRDRRRR